MLSVCKFQSKSEDYSQKLVQHLQTQQRDDQTVPKAKPKTGDFYLWILSRKNHPWLLPPILFDQRTIKMGCKIIKEMNRMIHTRDKVVTFRRRALRNQAQRNHNKLMLSPRGRNWMDV